MSVYSLVRILGLLLHNEDIFGRNPGKILKTIYQGIMRINLNVALNQEVDMLLKLYQAVFFYVLGKTGEFSLSKISGKRAMKRSKVPL